MSTTLIFEESIEGHRLEYINHLYKYATADSGRKYVFVLPPNFSTEGNDAQWSQASNVRVVKLLPEEVNKISCPNQLKASLFRSKILRKYILEHKASDVFLIFLMLYMPALLLFLPRNVKVSGIVYRIFLNEDSYVKSPIRQLLEWVRYGLMALSRRVKRVLLLNDQRSADTLNKKLRTDKFRRLADPFNPIEVKRSKEEIRKSFAVRTGDILFSHFGGLTSRKGTMEILKAIAILPEALKDKVALYFAGKVSKDIETDFLQRVETLKTAGWSISVKNEFVSYEFLGELGRASDCLLIPYFNTCQSSGLLGHAAFHRIPVIGPSKGLLGSLIRDYEMGTLIDEITPEAIAAAIAEFRPHVVPARYARENDVEMFLKGWLCLE